jgi:tetratricopeptide (TPR) repeat protein
MDCLTRYLLAVVAALGVLAGTAAPATASLFSNLFPKKEERKYTPKVTTYVAWADCQERQAETPGLSSSQKQNFLDIARQHYQKAMQVDPNHVPAYGGLARVYMNMNHLDKAQETYHRALQRFPKNMSLWYELGLCCCRAKQWDAAIRSLEKARELEPENRAANQTLGFCLARAGHVQEGLETLSRVMTPAEAHYNIARMLHHMQHDDLCRRFLGQALQLNPDLSGARSLQASLDEGSRPVLQIQFEEAQP